MSVQISAVVATYNRAGYLRKALQSLVDQSLPKEQYEIIVVDNGSQDETRQVVADFDCANLRYLYEPVQGVSRARNTGWQAAHGEYIAFVDDDGIASPTWLSTILHVFSDCKPTPGIVGGPLKAIWEAPRPDWLSDKMLTPLAVFDWGKVRIDRTDEGWMPITNMAVPRVVLQRAGGLREDLSRQGNSLRANAEVYFGRQVVSWGYHLIYDPEIVVHHHVSASRMTKKYYENWFYWQGRSDAIMLGLQTPLSLPARARLAASKLIWAVPRLLLMWAGPSADRFRRRCQVVEVWGLVTALFQSGESA